MGSRSDRAGAVSDGEHTTALFLWVACLLPQRRLCCFTCSYPCLSITCKSSIEGVLIRGARACSLTQKTVRNPNHHHFLKEYCNTPPLRTAEKSNCIAVLQCPQALRRGNYSQYSSHVYRGTPPICITIRLLCVPQCFSENLGGWGHRDVPHSQGWGWWGTLLELRMVSMMSLRSARNLFWHPCAGSRALRIKDVCTPYWALCRTSLRAVRHIQREENDLVEVPQGLRASEWSLHS